jgi:rRNA-processing protein FCF1
MAEQRKDDEKTGHPESEAQGAETSPAEKHAQGDTATHDEAENVMSPLQFDPAKMKNDMEVFMTSREDDEDSVSELATLYSGIGEEANQLAQFDPNITLPREGKEKIAEAMESLGEEFFQILDTYYRELEALVGRLLHQIKTKGVFAIARSTPENYECNDKYREQVAEIFDKMIKGRDQTGDKELAGQTERYRLARYYTPKLADIKDELMSKPFNQSENRIDTTMEICAFRTFLKQLGGTFKEKNPSSPKYDEIEEEYSDAYNPEVAQPADFLVHLIKKVLGHHKNTAAQKYSAVGYKENFDVVFKDDSEKLKVLLSTTVQILRSMNLIKYQKKILRLKDEI